MEADKAYRRRTQPLTQPSWGSTFRNPPGDHAGRLLEAAGLKGHRIGGAMWSDVHANFVTNLGGATAADCLALIRLARRRVRERFGVELELEVRLAGEFGPDEGV
jgi:UDP-N-acetylmuramate dehydrogenase